MKTVEYRVRPVTRYIVTAHTSAPDGLSGSQQCGEFDNDTSAYVVANALARDRAITESSLGTKVIDHNGAPLTFTGLVDWQLPTKTVAPTYQRG